MTEENSVGINVRISKIDAEGLEKLVENHKFISISDAVRQAIRNLVSENKPNTKSAEAQS